MKISWGTGIAATYTIFVLITLGLTYTMMTKNVDLVAANYYEKEIIYQQQINKINNTSKLREGMKFEFNGSTVNFCFPKIGDISGEITFYRPSDSKKDFKMPIRPDKDNKQIVDATKLIKGYWKIKIEWKANGIDYYNEEQVIL